MAQHTDLADVNEILCGYYVAGKKWFDPDAKKKLEEKKKKISAAEYHDQDGRAQVMADRFLDYARARGYRSVKNVFWTARPGVLQKAVDPKNELHIDQKGNPADILVEFTSGPSGKFERFLGLSAKSTGGPKGDIGFKNPGLGSVEKDLNLKLYDILTAKIAEAIKKFKLSEKADERKRQIRANPKIAEQVEEMGAEVLNKVRDKIFNKLRTMSDNDLKKYFLKEWMNASEGLYPPYVKVTGAGVKDPYTAKVEDPLKNEKLDAFNKGRITLEKEGTQAIRISAGGKRIFKIRAKFESQKLASSFKFSADPA